eukprot:TRINITY_DN46981_c0_g1_i1.p1 TRINITY_DN46981_c0_g1~~TRINITY_DN46981_c0_g1_i1.p1  ORF type:complete len:173 (+),score=15.23 TRINITY_DN46981_c0_g1_i1:103-621(+)
MDVFAPSSDSDCRTDSDEDSRSSVLARQSNSDSSDESYQPKDSVFSELRLGDLWNSGLVAHYFVIGLLIGALPAIINGLFLGYLNVPSYLLNVALNVTNLPLCFTFLFGMLSDSKPILGRRRKPYMFIGWAITFAALSLMSSWPLPKPYYCFNADGSFEIEAPPCNPAERND